MHQNMPSRCHYNNISHVVNRSSLCNLQLMMKLEFYSTSILVIRARERRSALAHKPKIGSTELNIQDFVRRNSLPKRLPEPVKIGKLNPSQPIRNLRRYRRPLSSRCFTQPYPRNHLPHPGCNPRLVPSITKQSVRRGKLHIPRIPRIPRNTRTNFPFINSRKCLDYSCLKPGLLLAARHSLTTLSTSSGVLTHPSLG